MHLWSQFAPYLADMKISRFVGISSHGVNMTCGSLVIQLFACCGWARTLVTTLPDYILRAKVILHDAKS